MTEYAWMGSIPKKMRMVAQKRRARRNEASGIKKADILF